jgi:hypothetical protein
MKPAFVTIYPAARFARAGCVSCLCPVTYFIICVLRLVAYFLEYIIYTCLRCGIGKQIIEQDTQPFIRYILTGGQVTDCAFYFFSILYGDVHRKRCRTSSAVSTIF